MRERLEAYIWSYNAGDPEATYSAPRHFLQIAVMVGRDLLDGQLTLRAMSLVYTTILSLVPLLAVSISVLKGFGVQGQLEPALLRLLAPLGDDAGEISARIVDFVENMRVGVLGAVGLGLLIYTTISLIQKIESAFNYTWRTRSSRNLMRRFSDYLSVIMVGPVLIFSAVGITASLSNNTVIDMLNSLPYLGGALHFGGKLLPYLLVIAAFAFIYMLVPNTRVDWRSALYGAITAGILWETSSLAFTSFVSGSTKYTAIYSGFAILLVFMIWLYLAWLILLIGSSIAFYHQNPERLGWRRRDAHLSARMRERLALQAMVDIALVHDRQASLATDLDGLAGRQQVPSDILARMLDALEADGLVVRSDEDPPRYLPAVSLEKIRLSEILRSARTAEDDGQADARGVDHDVAGLLRELEQGLDAQLGDTTLADFVRREGAIIDANRYVQRQ